MLQLAFLKFAQLWAAFFWGWETTCLWLQSADAFTVLGVASLGAAIVRLFSSVCDRSASIKNIGGVVAEALLGVLFPVYYILNRGGLFNYV